MPGDTTFTVRLPAAVSSALSDDTPEASEDDELHDSAEMTVEAAEAEATAESIGEAGTSTDGQADGAAQAGRRD
jgi:hypothetical protein